MKSNKRTWLYTAWGDKKYCVTYYVSANNRKLARLAGFRMVQPIFRRIYKDSVIPIE